MLDVQPYENNSSDPDSESEKGPKTIEVKMFGWLINFWRRPGNCEECWDPQLGDENFTAENVTTSIKAAIARRHPQCIQRILNAFNDSLSGKQNEEVPCATSKSCGLRRIQIDVRPYLSCLSDDSDEGLIECVQILVNAGACVQSLFQAIEDDDTMVLRYLLNMGAVPNAVDGKKDISNDGETPLTYAVECDAIDCVKMLIEHGCDVNASDAKQRTGLMKAAFWVKEETSTECFLMLLDSGADVNMTDCKDHKALYYLTCSGGADIDTYEECIAALLRAGVSINERDENDGTTTLMRAAYCRNENLVRVAIQAGADVNLTDMHGETALMYAPRLMPKVIVDTGSALNTTIHIMKLLLSNGALINMKPGELSRRHEHIKKLKKQAIVQRNYNSGTEGEEDEVLATILHSAYRRNLELMERKINRCLMLLHASGEMEICPHLPGIELQDLARTAIRKHLIRLDPHHHLFNRIPQLKLPPAITSYLLYEESLEISDDEDSNDDDDDNDDNDDSARL